MQIWKCVISCINLWFANVKSEILEGSGRFQIEAGWWKVAETNVRSAHCSAMLPLLLQLLLQLFLQLLLQFGTSQLFLTLRSFPVPSLIFYISKERIDLSSSSIPALSYSWSCLCSSVWTLSTFQLPIGILCYIVIFLNPLSPNTHQKGNGWIRSVPNMEKLLWRRSEKLMPPCILSTILTNRLFSVVVQTKECCPTFTGSSVFDRGSEISKYGRPD